MLLEKFKKDFERREITKQEGSFSLLIYGSVFPIAFPPYINRYYDFDFKSFLFFAKEDRGTIFFDLVKYSLILVDKFISKLYHNVEVYSIKY